MPATGTVTPTVTSPDTGGVAGSGYVTKTSIAWTSDASAGTVTGDTVTLPAGTVLLVEFIQGSPTPTTAYSVDLLDPNGISVFGTIGATLDSSKNERGVPTVSTGLRQWIVGGVYQLTVSAAGNSKQGTVNIYQMRGVV